MGKRTGRKAGQPTKYMPEYCAQLYEHMCEGLSFAAFAGLIGVTTQTLTNWAAAHEEFADARERGLAASLLWWERLGQQGVQGFGPEVLSKRIIKPDGSVEEQYEGAKFNTGTWVFNMKNRFPEDWKDRHDLTMGVDLAKLSDQERAGLLAEAIKALTPAERTTVLDLLQGADGVYRPAELLPGSAKDGA